MPPKAADLSASGGWTMIGHLTDRSGNLVEIRMVDVGLAPKQESWIVVPLGRSDVASHSYLTQVSIYPAGDAFADNRVRVYPRRLFVKGSVDADLTLRAWLDEPDWSPAAHGMVPVPPDEVKQAVSFWRMPTAPAR